MTSSHLSAFLSKLSMRIAPHGAVRNLAIPQMNSPEVFDSFEPQFRQDLNEFFEPGAVDMIDYLSVNEYWFIMMAAAALVCCNCLPARTTDVQDGIFLLRNRIRRDPQGKAVLAKLQNGLADKLSGAETQYARQEGLLVWGETYPGGVGSLLVKVNPVFFNRTA